MKRRAFRPGVEAVEPRPLMSGLAAAAHAVSAEALTGRGFTASFAARYSEGAGLNKAEARRFLFSGKASSDFFANGVGRLVVVFPRSQSSPVSGQGIVYDNRQTNNSAVAFQLAGPAQRDARGRLVRIPFRTTAVISDGLPVKADVIAGTLAIRYGADGRALVTLSGTFVPARK